MSSSESSGGPGKAVAAEPPIAPIPAAGDDGQGDRDEGAPADAWFTPGPKQAAAAPGGDESPDWFLRTGRAGLVPDSVTDSWQDGTSPSPDQPAQGAAVGSPPWGAQPTEAAPGVPPPWENGPWPGHGDPRPAGRPAPVDAGSDQTAAGPVAAGPVAAGPEPTAILRRRSAQLALGGIVVVVVAVIIVVIVTATSGSPVGGCGTYPATVRQAYVRAMTDLRDHAPASVQSAAFAQAASRANASAAAAGQIGVRTAMFAMASDMNRAYADVAANRALPATLRQHLVADGTASPASCPG
jgi:hypothetical protein